MSRRGSVPYRSRHCRRLTFAGPRIFVIIVDSHSTDLLPDTTQGRLDEGPLEGTTEVAGVDDDEASVLRLESKLDYENSGLAREGWRQLRTDCNTKREEVIVTPSSHDTFMRSCRYPACTNVLHFGIVRNASHIISIRQA